MTVRTVDSHTHILTEEAMRLLAKESPKVTPVLKGLGTPRATLEIDGRVVQDPMPTEIWDLDMRLRDMDANGVDVQVLSPTVFTFFYAQEPKLALACAATRASPVGWRVIASPCASMTSPRTRATTPASSRRHISRHAACCACRYSVKTPCSASFR